MRGRRTASRRSAVAVSAAHSDAVLRAERTHEATVAASDASLRRVGGRGAEKAARHGGIPWRELTLKQNRGELARRIERFQEGKAMP